MDLKEEVTRRGFLKDITDEKVFELYQEGGKKFYIGFDPTADSLHVGNFVQFMHAVQYMKRGNHFILIVGGATGMIGDPGGKDSERSFLSEETLEHNVASITKQVSRILENLSQTSGHEFSFEVINNLDFYTGTSYIDFLRDVGKYITVNQMLNKETVKRRVEDPEKSISYTEFSYMLMQGYDFYRLFTEKGCHLQVAGSDQRGNVVTGIELIRKKCEQEAYGITCNLILDSTGKKFGKSEGNALWLDEEKTSPYSIYQYFMNATDEDVEKYLKLFTLLEFAEIEKIIEEHSKDPTQRVGQQKVAYYVTQSIFGTKAAEQAKLITETLFGDGEILSKVNKLDVDDLRALMKATNGVEFDQGSIIDLLESSQLFGSRGDAKKAIKSGSVFVNEKNITDIGYQIEEKDFLQGNVLLLRKGKKTYMAVLHR